MSEPRQLPEQLQQQLIELQTQLAFQEDIVQSLNEVVVAQQQRLDQLQQTNVRLERQLGEVLAWLNSQAPSAPPPHY